MVTVSKMLWSLGNSGKLGYIQVTTTPKTGITLYLHRFHSGLTGNTESELVWMKNPGNLGADGENWDNWEQHVLITEGPDVYLQFEKLEADGVTYDTFVTGLYPLTEM